ncbi:2-hydroxyacid dehydrogenase [Solimonas marina]|uniref:2-hydroxyacid dehydrogenase n=1 Tax=Solimonas marina TaxID=2714601 RepID=A0A970B749_9GAMM|nr:2-hydroxyacid dehydrogenase [Solimonas marina]NKF20844.1 2-hydroxyacid dehydrogenase [Solimonas marina]
MRPRLLQHGRLLPWLEAELAAHYDCTMLEAQADPDAYLATHGGEFTLMATSVRTGADAALIERLPQLKMIAVFGVGYETVDLDATRARGIVVSNTPDVLNDCVADLAVGALIDLLRGISASDRHVRAGRWPQRNFPLATRVSGKQLGIVGLGRIGEAIARRASGFDMTVCYHNRRPRPDCPYEYVPDLLDLARRSDVLMVAAAATPGAPPTINAEVLTALGADGWLVNIARGALVDEPALVAALQAGTIAGAALDVFADEPNVPAALWSLDNVVLMPHIASATHETRRAMAELVFANLQHYVQHGQALTAVP